jgi:hypothetical protein
METLRNLQRDITQARANLAAADEAYYQSLQRWALSQQGGDRIEPLRQQRRDAQARLDGASGGSYCWASRRLSWNKCPLTCLFCCCQCAWKPVT